MGCEKYDPHVGKTNREASTFALRLPIGIAGLLISRVMLARFGAAHYQFSAKEFFIVQFLDGTLRFFDRLHLHESESFRALVVPVTHDFGVLHMSDAIKQLEEVALGSVKRQVADIQPRRSDFDYFRFTRWPRGLRAIARCCRGLLCPFPVSEKCRDSLPECFLGRLPARFLARAIAPLSRPTARTARASPG